MGTNHRWVYSLWEESLWLQGTMRSNLHTFYDFVVTVHILLHTIHIYIYSNIVILMRNALVLSLSLTSIEDM